MIAAALLRQALAVTEAIHDPAYVWFALGGMVVAAIVGTCVVFAIVSGLLQPVRVAVSNAERAATEAASSAESAERYAARVASTYSAVSAELRGLRDRVERLERKT